MNEITRVEAAPLAMADELGGGSIAAFLDRALASGRPMAELEKALDILERAEAIRREALFNAAFAEFKRTCPPIIRKTTDNYNTVTKNGVQVKRMYAAAEDISAVVDGPLGAVQLAYYWSDPEITANGCLSRKFVLSHSAGHSRSTASPPIPIEGGEAYKAIAGVRKETSASPQQRLGVADGFAKRYSMVAGLGVTTFDQDHELLPDTAPKITEDQANIIGKLCLRCEANVPVFLNMFGAENISDIKASDYESAVGKLNSKLANMGGRAVRRD